MISGGRSREAERPTRPQRLISARRYLLALASAARDALSMLRIA